MKESSRESDSDELGELYMREGDGGLLWSSIRLAIVYNEGRGEDSKKEENPPKLGVSVGELGEFIEGISHHVHFACLNLG